MVLWYRSFQDSSFDTQHRIPRFPITILFPGLPLELQHSISDFCAHFGMVLSNSFVDAMINARVPWLRVVVEDLLGLPFELEIVIDLCCL